MNLREDLIKYVKKIIGDIPDVEDIVQDTLLISIEKRKDLIEESKYQQWVFRIARNISIDFLKKNQKKLPQITDLVFIEEGKEKPNSFLALAEDNKHIYDKVKEDFLEKNKSPLEIKSYFSENYPEVLSISDNYFEALLLAEFKGISQQDIADQLQLPLPTIKSRIQRARQKIKDIFLKRCQIELDARGGIVNYYCEK